MKFEFIGKGWQKFQIMYNISLTELAVDSFSKKKSTIYCKKLVLHAYKWFLNYNNYNYNTVEKYLKNMFTYSQSMVLHLLYITGNPM